MIIQSTPFTSTVLSTLLEAYYNGSSYVGLQSSDLLNSALPSSIINSPKQVIKQVSGAFTFPTNFFGAHIAGASSVAATTASGVRLRDYGVRWSQIVLNTYADTSSGGWTISTSTVNWPSHGLNAGNHGFCCYNVGGAIPTGVSVNTMYYLTNVQANTFQLSLSPNGAPIVLSGSKSGTTTMQAIATSVINSLDQIVNACFSAGKDLIYDCSTIPGSLSVVPGDIYNCPAAQISVTSWIAFLVNRYGTKIGYFEIWNEPNTPGYCNMPLTSGASSLLYYAAWIYQAVAATGQAANIKVLSPSWTGSGFVSQFATYLQNGGAGNCDIVAFHSYAGGGTFLSANDAAIDAILSVTTNAGNGVVGKPVWITEVGESFPNYALVFRHHVYAAAKGIARMYWYSYDLSDGVGMMKLTDNATLASAYNTMITNLAGSSIAYVNKGTNRQIGISANGNNYVV